MHVCLSAPFLVVFCFVLFWTLKDNMGQADSHPLNIVLDHFKEVRTTAHNLLVVVKKRRCTHIAAQNGQPLELDDCQRGPFTSHDVSSRRQSVPTKHKDTQIKSTAMG